MRYYKEILLPQVEGGDIIYYELQKEYILQPKFIHNNKTIQPIKYVADFFIRFKDGTEEVVDTKGMPDNTAKLKRKIFWYVYPDITYRWVGFSGLDGGWTSYEDIQRARKIRKKLKEKASNA